MSKNYYDDVGEEAVNQHITGTGQFKLISHVANDIVNLEGVRNHWLRSPGFATVKILEVPEETTRIAMLQSGQVDALAVSQPQVSTVEEIPGITFVAPRYLAAKGGPVVHFGGNWIMTESDGNPYENTARPDKPWVGGNMGDADFEDARNVRLAMAYAIDREEMLQEIVDGKGCVGYTFGIDTCNARWEERWATPFDVDKAQGLLAEAGYEDGFEVTFWNYSAPDTDMGQSCEAIANYWTKNLGPDGQHRLQRLPDTPAEVHSTSEAWTSCGASGLTPTSRSRRTTWTSYPTRRPAGCCPTSATTTRSRMT